MRKIKSILFILVAVNLLSIVNVFSAHKQWEKVGYSKPKISDITDQLYGMSRRYGYTHRLELDVVMIRGCGWDKNTIIKRLIHLADIFKQCRIKFEDVDLIEIDPPNGRLDFFPWYRPHKDLEDKFDSSTYLLAKSYHNTGKRFSITYIRSFTNGETGSAGPVWYCGINSTMLYKAFISLVTTENDYLSRRPKGYSVEAHELGHALFDCAHVGRDNIMALTARKRLPVVREDHCRKARAHKLVRNLSTVLQNDEYKRK